MAKDDRRNFYLVKDLSKRYVVSPQSITNWIRKGKIKATKFGRGYRIPVQEVERLDIEGVPDDDEDTQEEQNEDMQKPEAQLALVSIG